MYPPIEADDVYSPPGEVSPTRTFLYDRFPHAEVVGPEWPDGSALGRVGFLVIFCFGSPKQGLSRLRWTLSDVELSINCMR